MNEATVNKRVCKVEGCQVKVHGLGYCTMHYLRQHRYGDVSFTKITRYHHSKERCAFPGCGRRIRRMHYCTLHYQRWQKHGDPAFCQGRKPGLTRSYVRGQVGFIELTQGKWAKVDAKNFDHLNRWLWSYHRGYAVRKEKGRTVRMHQVIAQTPAGLEPDHISRNKLDNRESNLKEWHETEELMESTPPKASPGKEDFFPVQRSGLAQGDPLLGHLHLRER